MSKPEAKSDPEATPEPKADEATSPRPRKQRGTKRKRPKLDSRGNERPPFLRPMPDDPDLNRVIEAFEQGNYAFVRSEAARLTKTSESKRVREAAAELRRRLDPDPLIRYLLLAAFALLAFLVTWAYATH